MRIVHRSRFLLDTHLLLWWLGGAAALSARAKELIASEENTIFVSAVSFWEIRLKQSLQKLRLPAMFEGRFASEPFEHLPLTAAHTTRLLSLAWHHRDPFDRMLVAQAQEENLILLTADGALQAYGDSVWLL